MLANDTNTIWRKRETDHTNDHHNTKNDAVKTRPFLFVQKVRQKILDE